MTRFHPMRLALAAVVAVIAFGSLSMLHGCAVLESPAAQPFDQVAVTVAVDTVVGAGIPAVQAPRAAAIVKIAQEVLAADTGVVTTVDSIEAVAASKVAALGLPPGDQAAAALFLAVLDSAVNTYVAKLSGGATAANTAAAIATVCNWVIAEGTRLGG